jgi:Ca2+-binding RTX toxin-like protein
LEERRLLSGVSLSRGGTLYVEGSRADDHIAVTRDAANKSVIRVTLNGDDSSFRYGRVKRIVISAGRGDDTCTVNKKVVKPALIQGGLGDDSIYGGGGDDSLLGHDGDDSCNGGAGDDSIVSGRGRDTLNGGDGDDSCKGGVGEDDSVRGGRGDDAYDDPKDVDDDDDNDRHRRRRGPGSSNGGGDDDDDDTVGGGNDDDGTPDQGPGDN